MGLPHASTCDREKSGQMTIGFHSRNKLAASNPHWLFADLADTARLEAPLRGIAAFSGNAGSLVTSNAICIRSLSPCPSIRRRMKSANSETFDYSHGPPRKLPCARINRPGIPSNATTAKFVGVRLPKCATPLTYGFIGYDDPPLCQKFLNITKTE